MSNRQWIPFTLVYCFFPVSSSPCPSNRLHTESCCFFLPFHSIYVGFPCIKTTTFTHNIKKGLFPSNSQQSLFHI
ncbi:hypothetical protein BDV35DRAFT_355527 [Aspergillus flavus]|uniref:Secreted protein n=1 Tax=Aspergillus flavus TaxID=5059 RepID=A0A5N6GU51_ASPFL|nr:hypothetical protein BDV35DRAFT_355527 [Aspergillus flavus]